MMFPAQSQIAAGLRYAGVIASSVSTVVVGFGLLPADTAHAIVDAFQKLMSDLQPVFGDLYVLGGLLFPIIAGVLVRMGWKASSPKSQAAAVQSRNDQQVLTTNADLAKDVPGVKLVPASEITNISNERK
jgi:hypothetical protein